MSACNSIHTSAFEDDEIFDDSTFLANFDNISFKQTKVSDSNVNDSINTSASALNVSALCCDEEISGYDKITGQTWIYPTNYPVRDYQFNIIKSAILKNTLVSLPTGLGKTFIAAVIMYNYFRWYPLGKIVFTAPTRPLVAQQIDACYNIVAIPPNDTIEMTGHMQVATRKTHWQNKRVFFATPQVIYNDLKSGICPADKIRCLVIDEAHRARGNYAYCQIVGALDDLGHKTYRLLALSATPGSKVEDVINVVKSLHIHHLELRTENCIDVAPYSHSRKINTVVIQLGPELTHLRQQYVEILDYYARRLKQFNILPHNLGNLSKGRIVMLYKEYQTKDRGTRHPQHNYIMKDFTILIALYHGLELLVKHGSRVFLNFFDEHPEKSWIQSDDRLTAVLERLRDDLGVNPLALDRSILPDGTIPEMPNNLCFGHPKFDKLKEIMVHHFTNAKMKQQDTKAIVFCEYRESVNLVHCMLLQCRPLIVPLMFVGQGASGKDGKAVVSQKQQLRTMRSFRSGACNALVATCVAEEGLDVGSVDLILCFDISTRSPIRLVQRCGRTGRERGGQVFILVTEGREHQTLQDCMRQRDGLNKKIQHSKEVQNNLYKMNPRMIPHGFTPQIQKMYITVAKKDEPKEKPSKKAPIEKFGKGQKDLRTMLAGRASTSSASPSKKIKLNFEELQQSFDSEFENRTMKKVEPTITDEPILINSQDTQAQIIVAPSPVKIKQTKKKQKIAPKSPAKNYGDIRALFSTATKSTKSYTKIINELGVNDSGVPTKLLNLLVDLNLDNSNAVKTCYNCQYICDCKTMKYTKDTSKPVLKFITEPFLPNLDLINDMDTETILKCGNIKETQDIVENISREISNTNIEKVDKFNCSANFDLEFDFDEFEFKTLDEKNKDIPATNFDIGYIDDIFADISPEAVPEKELEVPNKITEPVDKPKETEEALGFFGLDSVDDIFASDDSVIQVSPEPPKVESRTTKPLKDNNKEPENKQNATILKDKNAANLGYPISPSILSGQLAISRPTSPILCSQAAKLHLNQKHVRPSSSTPNTRLRKNLLADYTNNKNVTDEKSNVTDKSMFTITQLVNMINKTEDKSVNDSNVTTNHNVLMSDEERSTSPILLTQAERAKSINTNRSSKSMSSNKSVNKSLIILDSDSDSNEFNDTLVYDYYKELSNSDTSKNSQCKSTQSKKISLFDAISDEIVESQPKKICIINTATKETVATKSKMNISSIVAKRKISVDASPEVNYDAKPKESQVDANKKDSSPVLGKRKFDDEDNQLFTASPYFNKKQKLEDADEKPLTIQQKVLAAISSNKNKLDFNSDLTNYSCTVSQPNFYQKENTNPENKVLNKSSNNIRPLEVLQKYKKESKILSLRKKFNTIFKKSPSKPPVKISPIKNHVLENSDIEFLTCEDYCSPRKSRAKSQKNSSKKDSTERTIDDSDDDFINWKSGPSSPRRTGNEDKVIMSTTNHKVRKKKSKNCSLLDMEAALSDSDSGDELTDDSAGSIAEFICDDNDITHHVDMQAVYLKSIRSPVKKNGFKIPELPKKYNKADVFSQFVAEDSYEMDSFCVDSHIGLTQVNDLSELELVEIALNKRRKKRHRSSSPEQNESPLVKCKYKKVKRLKSDSEDSS